MTKTELAQLALRKLGVISANETPSAADDADMQATYTRLYAELLERGLATWPEATIPDRIGEHLANVMAGRMRPQFTGEAWSPSTIEAETRVAMRPLLEILVMQKSQARTKAEYY